MVAGPVPKCLRILKKEDLKSSNPERVAGRGTANSVDFGILVVGFHLIHGLKGQLPSFSYGKGEKPGDGTL
jgi:hypothetical protein